MWRLAHVSDLHVLSPLGTEWRQALFNKRVTSYVNVLLHRGRVFRPHFLDRVLAGAAERADHVVVTGDITNVSLPSEFAEARARLDRVAASVDVTVVPGNHDIYLPSVSHDRRFARHFAPFLESDLPSLAVDVAAGRFPVVKLRGPAALIGLSSGVPRPPFISAGLLGHAQLNALRAVLAHPEVARRLPIVLVHHDPIDPRFRLDQLQGGLVDARSLRESLGALERGLVLFGHLHVRRRNRLLTRGGALDVFCASGGSLDHPHGDVRAGFNLYTLEDDGRLTGAEAWVLDAAGEQLERRELPFAGEAR